MSQASQERLWDVDEHQSSQLSPLNFSSARTAHNLLKRPRLVTIVTRMQLCTNSHIHRVRGLSWSSSRKVYLLNLGNVLKEQLDRAPRM